MAQLKSNIYYGLHNVLCGVLHGMSLQLRHLQRAGIYTMLLSLIFICVVVMSLHPQS